MSNFVGILIVLFSFQAMALVPVEGIIMGTAREEYQEDPLALIFRDIYDRTQKSENKKLRYYHHTWSSGTYLNESCSILGPISYPNSVKENQAKRSVTATLQYLGLDISVRAIGAYAKVLDIGEEDFNRLTENLINNYCSKNLTVFSLKGLRHSLLHYYRHPQPEIIPSVENSPFATENFKYRTEGREARSNEFEYLLRGFRSFCSWGGSVDDYRVLTPYLNNRFIMASVFKNMTGKRDQYDDKMEKIRTEEHNDTVQVLCENFICRRVGRNEFNSKFPLSIGSTGAETDLKKLYCQHFRFLDFSPTTTVPEVRTWMKSMELEESVFETNFFISLLTGIPDPFMGITNFVDLPFLAKSSIDERWNQWARNVLDVFSHGLLFEESLKIKPLPLRDSHVITNEGFKMNLTVTLGEMDRLMDKTDKFDLSFKMKISKNYLRAAKRKWKDLVAEVDLDGQKKFKQEMAEYLGIQLKAKEKFFTQKVWNNELQRLITDELLEQVFLYRGNMFNTYQDEMLSIPVNFSYGIFAIGYLRYRADVRANRLKLNL